MADTGRLGAEASPSPDGEVTLDALRERGAPRIDPVRFHLVESLLRRAAAHDGEARRLLEDKVVTLLQALSDAVARSEASSVDAMAEQMGKGQSEPGELAQLLAHIAQQKPGGANAIAAPTSLASAKGKLDSPVDPKTLEFFRRTWSRLSSDQRLAQSRSSLPDNAGPLNSQHLVHRSLDVMRELSPEYFDLFISHVDALLWLERANEQAAKEIGLSPRAKGSKKAAGAKRG